jgi:hypothetical protein
MRRVLPIATATLLLALVLAFAACAPAKTTRITPIYEVVGQIEEATRQLEAERAKGQPARAPSGESFSQALNTWVGKDVSGLIEKLGVPRKDYKMPNGNFLYEFLNEGPARVVASQQGEVYQNVTFPQYCKISVVTNPKHQVLNATWVGNMCN